MYYLYRIYHIYYIHIHIHISYNISIHKGGMGKLAHSVLVLRGGVASFKRQAITFGLFT